MNAIKLLSKRNCLHLRRFSKCSSLFRSAAASEAVLTEPLTIPLPPDQKVFSPKLEKIALEISNLNLIEVSELSQLLKKKLNLPDQPMMPMGAFAMQGQAAKETEEDDAPKQIKTEFTVKITGFDETKKVAIIKEIKNSLEGFNLVQAKKFIENLPAVLKADTTKEEADKLKEIFTNTGAIVEIV